MPANIYESVKRALQDIVAPELRTIQGQIDSMRVELRTEIKRLDEKIDSLDKRLNDKVDGLKGQFELAIDLHERLAALEAKINR